MAPPDLYAHPPQPGLMAPGHAAQPVSLRNFLWVVACLLGVVEFLADSFMP